MGRNLENEFLLLRCAMRENKENDGVPFDEP